MPLAPSHWLLGRRAPPGEPPLSVPGTSSRVVMAAGVDTSKSSFEESVIVISSGDEALPRVFTPTKRPPSSTEDSRFVC